MSRPGFRLRHLTFAGPTKESASISFGPGLNIIYGASDTGKSFLIEAIDFMLGAKPPLRDVPERVGYDRILLGIETLGGEVYTLHRSVDGGRFRLYQGLIDGIPGEEIEFRELADKHNENNTENLSSFLLGVCELSGKRVRRNKRGDTNSLSFRNLARLTIVTEIEITDRLSPLSDGNPTADTPNFATFKLLLTGVDDSALVSSGPKTPEDQTREAQAQLLDDLIEDYRARLKNLTKSPKELDDQLEKIDVALHGRTEQLRQTEAEFRELVARRRSLREKLELGRDRNAEVDGLLGRFDLLAKHYRSDIERLRGIEEAGTLFVALGEAPCPLCGAGAEFHRQASDCGGNVEAVVLAARSEIAKVQLLQTELTETVAVLQREGSTLKKSIPRLDGQLSEIAVRVKQVISPSLARMRSDYSDLALKRGKVREALSMLQTVEDVQTRRALLEKDIVRPEQGSELADGDLPTRVADNFAKVAEEILTAWDFPGADRVFFDAKARDLMIDGKLRTARGKGLRAITHAAFSVALLEYCMTMGTNHPGFVALDSPLLAYRAPEGEEDDLSGTQLNQNFYDYLSKLPETRQFIVVENTDPPAEYIGRSQVTLFSKNPHSGRYGFFPV